MADPRGLRTGYRPAGLVVGGSPSDDSCNSDRVDDYVD